MTRMRGIVVLVIGLLQLLSAFAHSMFGWKGMREQLVKAQAPGELIKGVAIGWHFGGFAMFAFGCMLLWLYSELRKGRASSMFPALVIGVMYMICGGWAFVVSGYNPFFVTLFVTPGVLLSAVSWGAPARI